MRLKIPFSRYFPCAPAPSLRHRETASFIRTLPRPKPVAFSLDCAPEPACTPRQKSLRLFRSAPLPGDTCLLPARPKTVP
ncbi:hypothetical protein [Gaoshiqia sediminis]|uniref:Uncharacterized protein n=1 Tax=Gaoshiqia sediminis TaxID=2986998 RepID=A0AA41YBL6_9BACT|nr:hypothetical protein [Gaoshiqia sediminis]MCW0484768.1 hypothetical protein [Gaoshiqia sediminis]